MTNALRTDLNDFLFTPIAADAAGMHLTMLSALARSGVDPWAEAAGLAALPPEEATQKLVSMLASVPNGPSPGDDTATLAARLVAQLHASPRHQLRPVPAAVDGPDEGPLPISFSAPNKLVRLTIYGLLVVLMLAIGFRGFGG